MEIEKAPDEDRMLGGTDGRWRAVRGRDPSADGTFVYAVRTTGVYCRPSCGARAARPENVSFHDTPADAERAGFRPCLRCQPGGPPLAERQAAWVADLCRFIDEADAQPSLDELAARAGVSAFHLQRVFKRVTGVTPRAYAAGRRAERFRAALAAQAPVTDALYDAGYGSPSRLYEKSDEVLGMTPRRFRDGGPGEDIRFAVGESSLGSLLVAATERGVCALLLGDDPEALIQDLERRFPRARLAVAGPEFEQTVASVVGLVERPRDGADLPLDVRGTAFQRRVWDALTRIPPGRTTSYAELAAAIGSPQSIRAVAGACAANALAVAIPCHRVVRTGGDLAGYRWGVERKRALLERESST